MKKINDLIDPSQFKNEPASIKIEFNGLHNIDVKFDGQFLDVIGLGADIYCAMVEEVIEQDLLNSIIEIGWFQLLIPFAKELKNQKAIIDFSIDETSNIVANVNGNSVALAAGYYQFLQEVTKYYDISIGEYFEIIKGNYEAWKKSDKKRVFQQNIKREYK